MTLKQLIVFFILTAGQLKAQSILQTNKWAKPNTSEYVKLEISLTENRIKATGYFIRLRVSTKDGLSYFLGWHQSGGWLAFQDESFQKPLQIESRSNLKFYIPEKDHHYRIWVSKSSADHGYARIVVQDLNSADSTAVESFFLCRPKTFEKVTELNLLD